jgi:hypothetical protein
VSKREVAARGADAIRASAATDKLELLLSQPEIIAWLNLSKAEIVAWLGSREVKDGGDEAAGVA